MGVSDAEEIVEKGAHVMYAVPLQPTGFQEAPVFSSLYIIFPVVRHIKPQLTL